MDELEKRRIEIFCSGFVNVLDYHMKLLKIYPSVKSFPIIG